jgi:hypothetical protein
MIWGYAKAPANEDGLLELKEVSMGFPPQALREIARFLQTAADEIEKNDRPRHWHLHIDSCVKNWGRQFPDIGLVVVNLASDRLPPRVEDPDE